MLCKRKGLTRFKGKVKKKLKQLKKELKARIEYAERLNKENNELVEVNKNCIKNMQATIDQKDKEINHLKKNLAVVNIMAKNLGEQVEGEQEKFNKIANFFECTEEEKRQIKQDLDICNNRIKYEFRGE